jgi:hypothetical protein
MEQQLECTLQFHYTRSWHILYQLYFIPIVIIFKHKAAEIHILFIASYGYSAKIVESLIVTPYLELIDYVALMLYQQRLDVDAPPVRLMPLGQRYGTFRGM